MSILVRPTLRHKIEQGFHSAAVSNAFTVLHLFAAMWQPTGVWDEKWFAFGDDHDSLSRLRARFGWSESTGLRASLRECQHVHTVLSLEKHFGRPVIQIAVKLSHQKKSLPVTSMRVAFYLYGSNVAFIE